MNRQVVFALCLIAIASVAGCTPRTEDFTEAARSSLEIAIAHEDIERAVELFADDAVMLPPGSPEIKGRDAIHEFYVTFIQHSLSYVTESKLVLSGGDVAVDQGDYRIRDVQKGQNIETGKYLNVWRHTDGKWKLSRLIWNTNGPVASVTVAPASPED